MLLAALGLLSVAVLLGLWLAGTHPGDRGGFGHWPLVHGGGGTVGLLALVLAWRHGALGGPFGVDALALVGGGLLLGLGIALWAWRRRRVPAAVVMVHAALGGIGYLIVAGFAFG